MSKRKPIVVSKQRLRDEARRLRFKPWLLEPLPKQLITDDLYDLLRRRVCSSLGLPPEVLISQPRAGLRQS